MTTFDSREAAFENKFAHDAELQFNVAARRNKLFGLWAAQKLGRSGEAAEAYAGSVVIADLAEPGDEDVIGKVINDLAAAGITETEVRGEFANFAAEARRQVMERM